MYQGWSAGRAGHQLEPGGQEARDAGEGEGRAAEREPQEKGQRGVKESHWKLSYAAGEGSSRGYGKV